MPHLLPTWLKNKNSSCWYFMPHHETGLTSHWQSGPCCLVGSQSLSHKPPSCFCQKRFVWLSHEKKKKKNTVHVLEASSRLKEKCSGQGMWTIKVHLYSKSKQWLTRNMQPQWAALIKWEGAGCIAAWWYRSQQSTKVNFLRGSIWSWLLVISGYWLLDIFIGSFSGSKHQIRTVIRLPLTQNT